MKNLQSPPLRILFLTESREDYLADSILHGLISLGNEVTDYPRKDILYRASTTSQLNTATSVRGHGFTLYGLLAGRPIDRSLVIQRLEQGCFDLVVIGQIWRQWGQLLDLSPLLQTVPVVLLDGDDDTRLFHRSGTRVRRYGWQPFPIRSGRCFYFKRELQIAPIRHHLCQVVPVTFSIPEEKIRISQPTRKTQRIATHCVDHEIARACGLHTKYAFASEEAYYADLQASRFAVTTKRGGWDCLRHYEIAAAGAVPCFRNLDDKPGTCAPHGLQPGLNCLTYRDWHDLQGQLDALDAKPNHYIRMLEASQDWVRQFTSTKTAQRLLDAVFSR